MRQSNLAYRDYAEFEPDNYEYKPIPYVVDEDPLGAIRGAVNAIKIMVAIVLTSLAVWGLISWVIREVA